jgi:hypothetical protein
LAIESAQHYKFKLSAWHKTGDAWHFYIQSVPTLEEHKEREVFFPFSALPWLPQQMVTMLKDHES